MTTQKPQKKTSLQSWNISRARELKYRPILNWMVIYHLIKEKQPDFNLHLDASFLDLIWNHQEKWDNDTDNFVSVD